ncbi:hypothetical protein OSTOST_06494, partial [Ostertagia ostertagi]
MEGDKATPQPKTHANSRSNIPRPTTYKVPQPVSATVQAARNLKRRSIGHLSKPPSCTPAKRTALSTSATPSSLAKPLPDSMRTGRATLATPGTVPRYLQTTAATARRTGMAKGTRPGSSQNQTAPPTRRSASTPRESAEVIAMRTKIVQLEGEVDKCKAESELIKSSLECFKQTITLKDSQLSTIQLALEAEKGKSAMMQVEIDTKGSKIAQLEHDLCERMEDIGRLTSHLAAKR